MLITILQKELLRVFTDKRLVFSTFILPAISIYIIYSLMGNLAGNLQDDLKEHNNVMYFFNAPNSFKDMIRKYEDDYHVKSVFLEGATIVDSNKEVLKQGKVEVFVLFESGFEGKVIAYKEIEKMPKIDIYYNPTRDYSKVAKNDVEDLLDLYKQQLLTTRFGNLNYVNVFELNSDEEALMVFDDKKAGESVISMVLPLMLSIILFAGAMGIGMDSIAGEKERGTMATLLVTPVDRNKIAIGKVLSLGIVSLVSALCSFVAILASLPKMTASFGELEAQAVKTMTKISFGPIQLFQLLILMITLVGIYVGIICLVSVHAKSVKEAGTYISPIYMVIMVAAFSSMYSLGESLALYKFLIPIYGSINGIKEVLSSELSAQEFLVTFFTAMLTMLILIRFITKAFNDEKVMFNT